mmetsp:Transcript_58289/g.148090  ORF Transcript_58289/g.148090 Transcript_58289/m.148090 type:complete len:116 (+) Transcript_58289:704-1051(+)
MSCSISAMRVASNRTAPEAKRAISMSGKARRSCCGKRYKHAYCDGCNCLLLVASAHASPLGSMSSKSARGRHCQTMLHHNLNVALDLCSIRHQCPYGIAVGRLGLPDAAKARHTC